MSTDSLHKWLFHNSGDTAEQLWNDLAMLRRIAPKMYEHLPASEELLLAGLDELKRQGLARAEGEGKSAKWFWVQPPEPVNPQRELF